MKLPLEAYLWSAGLVLMLWSTAGGKLAFQKSLLSSHFFSYLDFGWLYRPVMLFTSDIFHLFTECSAHRGTASAGTKVLTGRSQTTRY